MMAETETALAGIATVTTTGQNIFVSHAGRVYLVVMEEKMKPTIIQFFVG